MELIVMLVSTVPLGLLVRNRLAGYVAYTALHAFVFTFQTMILLMEWLNGDPSAFGPYPAYHSAWAYGVVNVAIYAAGLGLLTLGQRIARRRRARATAIDLDPSTA